ncbi:hypothetical protein [Streptomyces lydicus]|uniref:hypothetical protein n=1 Tax=Streptomyces lydicus TaxID=47763 RepID=UPI0036EA6A68
MQSDLMTCVTSVLPRDERFLGAFEVGLALSDRREDDADVPPDRQPKVLVGRSGPGDKRRGFLSFLFETATLTDPKPGPVSATEGIPDVVSRDAHAQGAHSVGAPAASEQGVARQLSAGAPRPLPAQSGAVGSRNSRRLPTGSVV